MAGAVGGTLFVSKAVNLHSFYKEKLEGMGFTDVSITANRLDALNTQIINIKPKLLMIDSTFYQAGTPYMTGVMHGLFPKLKIAAVSFGEYPLRLAKWFIWHGARAYVSWWDGVDEFKTGMRAVREGREYISPPVEKAINKSPEWPEPDCKVSKKLRQILIFLCCGFIPERIGDEMHITRRTVTTHLSRLYNIFHVINREEMVAVAWELELVTRDDIRFYQEKS